jgi:hypothetical protein
MTAPVVVRYWPPCAQSVKSAALIVSADGLRFIPRTWVTLSAPKGFSKGAGLRVSEWS